MASIKSVSLVLGAASALLLMAAPASAVVTTFASFNAATAGNMIWQNNGTGSSNNTWRSNGFGGTFFTTTSAQSVAPRLAVPGGVGVTFTYLNSLNSFINNLPAVFTLAGTIANSPATTFGGFKFQQNIASTINFSFISAQNVIIQNTTFLAGANLLSGSFTQGTIVGSSNGTSGGFSSSTGGGATIVYTSDFLDFSTTSNRDMSLSLTSIVSLVLNVNQGLNNATNRALRSFRATATGSFSSDPAPRVTAISAVPEPQSWAMFAIGFGLIGVSYRRRSGAKSVLA